MQRTRGDLADDTRIVLQHLGPGVDMVADPELVEITPEDVRRAREQWRLDALPRAAEYFDAESEA